LHLETPSLKVRKVGEKNGRGVQGREGGGEGREKREGEGEDRKKQGMEE